MSTPIKVLFLDMGGVILTNGWPQSSRKLAAEKFSLDFKEFNDRHKLFFDTYESGKISLDDYLQQTVFYEPRSFTPEVFADFIFQQTQPDNDMLAFVQKLKKQYGIRIIALNNEGRELNDYRIRTFGLDKFIDAFISSAFVKLRKPDKEIYTLALDIAFVKPSEALYLDDRLVFINVARSLGIQGIQHISLEETRRALLQYGMAVD
ncbi:HAD family phosphatase [Paraflavitalea sp. CAU 1676]|jgi:putative hydrolase of the HAD superfamily|uniref:HAD family hydrolase n=1 Tax=Paraflavitalea sp. CAU 1676 TaxID=3032598 RepID=UPI0023DC23E1|nr:HAD family phosphatase [Paraflavitalea sp. CAU 1676]MDF2189903.1 HAD family phosphatase [Paraflavitalea sp. CAU 1676]